MHSTGQPVSQSGVGYVVQFCSFSHWHLIFYTLKVGICQSIMGIDLFGVLKSVLVQNWVEVLSQKTGKETHTKNVIKMFSILRPQAAKNHIKIAWPNNCVTLPRDFHS